MGQIIGHQLAQDYLLRSIKEQNLAHAYLFSGPMGVGKATLVNFFIAKLNQSKGETVDLNSPDILWLSLLEDKKDITIEQIRSVTEFLKLASWFGQYRVVIIEEAERLSEEASNALLKTLEEPLGRAMIILISSQPYRLLPTIVSRCQQINLSPVNQQELQPWLKGQVSVKDDLVSIIHLSQGCPGRALRLATNPEILKQRVKQAHLFVTFIESKKAKEINSWLKNELVSKKLSKESATDNKMIDLQNRGINILSIWLEVTRDLLLCKYGQTARVVYYVLLAKLQSLSGELSSNNLLALMKVIRQALIKLQSNANVKLTLEWVLISALGFNQNKVN
ncbi:MAG: DNA polymerase III subunit delta' [Patescibacteria group bacterium]